MVPLLILAGTTVASTAALAYDWLKSSTKNPEIIVEGVVSQPEEGVDFEKIAKILAIAGAAYMLYRKFKR